MSPKDERTIGTVPWTCPNDGMVYPWWFQGEHLFRNYDNDVFSGTRYNIVWMGIYLPQENRIDTTVPEPTWADDDDDITADDADVTIVSNGPTTLNGDSYGPITIEIRDGIFTVNNIEEDEESEESEYSSEYASDESEDERTDLTNLLDDDMFRQINKSVCNLVFSEIASEVGVDEEKYNEMIDEIDSFSEVWRYIDTLSEKTQIKYLTFLGMEVPPNNHNWGDIRDLLFRVLKEAGMWSFDDYTEWIDERAVHIE